MYPDDPLHEQLASMPEADAPERLWSRLDDAYRRRTRRRQWSLGGAAVLVLAVAGALPLHLSRSPAPAGASVPTTTARADPVAAPATAVGADARLRALDRELQAAYRRGAGEAEIAELWTTRDALLARRRGRPVDPVRI